jgi:hypothetical protein
MENRYSNRPVAKPDDPGTRTQPDGDKQLSVSASSNRNKGGHFSIAKGRAKPYRKSAALKKDEDDSWSQNSGPWQHHPVIKNKTQPPIIRANSHGGSGSLGLKFI